MCGRAVVAQTRSEYQRMPREQREQILKMLRRGIPDVLHALNQMMLSEISAGREAADAPSPRPSPPYAGERGFHSRLRILADQTSAGDLTAVDLSWRPNGSVAPRVPMSPEISPPSSTVSRP